MPINSTHEKFLHELGDVYDAENQILQGLQQMHGKASDPQLKSLLEQHVQETQQQISNLDQVFGQLGQQPQRVMCHGAKGIISEAQECMQEAGNDAIRDALMAGAACKVEHYEIASYRGLITGAQQMGQTEIVGLLQQNLQQEEQTLQRIEQSAPQLIQNAMIFEGAAQGSSDQASVQA